MSKSSPFFSDGGALRNKRNFSSTVVCLIIVATLWNTSSVSGAPAKLDSLESPFPLDLQPPVFEAAASPTSSTTFNQGDSANGQTIDSYGTPIESLQPIDTPDGRKVVSAQGLQFEIPNYASGITELKKPSDDLLPPFVAPFDPTTNSVTPNADDSKKIPLGSDRESFPPFNNVVTASGDTGSVTLPSKTIFSKSEDGKVITNNVFLNGGGATSVKPFAASNTFNNQQKDTFATQGFSSSTLTKATTASTSFNQFGSTSAGASGFVTAATGGASTSSFGSTSFGASASGGTKYTGRFGGPPGVLAPQGSGFTTAKPATNPVTYNRPAATTTSGFAASASASQSSNNSKFTGSFGGPPGVYRPYDNVKN